MGKAGILQRLTAHGALAALCLSALLAGCAGSLHDQRRNAPAERAFQVADLAKSDIDQVVEIDLDHSMASLRLLMEKLYRRNPRELHKNPGATIDGMIRRAFDPSAGWRFAELGDLHGTDALLLAFRPDYAGDRVFAFIAGLGGMLHRAYNGQREFFLFDRLDPQNLYNAARNIEIAAWKLANARDADGNLLLLSNALDASGQNLSFERELGKLIGYQDLLARVIAQRSNRALRFVVQNAASAVFLPIY